MLYGIPDILSPNLLKALREMGHADEIVIADGNYSAAADATRRPPIELRGYGTLEVVEAILAVLPLDDRATPAHYIVEAPGEAPREVSQRFRTMVEEAARRRGWQGSEAVELLSAVPREPDFHDRARRAYAIVATDDRTHYGCFILRKGALFEVKNGSTFSAGSNEEIWIDREQARAFAGAASFSRQTADRAFSIIQGFAYPSRFRVRGEVPHEEFEKHGFLRFFDEYGTAGFDNIWGSMFEKFLRAWVEHLKAE